jgi:hypothetical protein
MDDLKRPARLRPVDVVMDRAIEDDIAGRPSYPSGTVFMASDLASFGERIAERARDKRPIVIVYPDGEERFLVPMPRPGATLE